MLISKHEKKVFTALFFGVSLKVAMKADQFFLTIAAGVITALIIRGVEAKAQPEPETEQGGIWNWWPWD